MKSPIFILFTVSIIALAQMCAIAQHSSLPEQKDDKPPPEFLAAMEEEPIPQPVPEDGEQIVYPLLLELTLPRPLLDAVHDKAGDALFRIARFFKHFNNPKNMTRNEIARLMTVRKIPVPTLRALIDARISALAIPAIKALVEKKDGNCNRFLFQLLSDISFSRLYRREAISNLRRLKTRDMLQEFTNYTGDKDIVISAHAMAAVEELTGQPFSRQLVDRLVPSRGTTNPKIFNRLKIMGKTAVNAVLERYRISNLPSDVIAYGGLLAEIYKKTEPRDDVLEAFEKKLNSGNITISMFTARQLGDMQYTPKAAAILMASLENKNVSIRKEAARSLGRLRAEEAADALIGLLGSGNSPAAKAAVVALGNLKDGKIPAAIADAYWKGNREFKKTCLVALERSPVAVADDALRKIINKETERYMQLEAKKALYRRGKRVEHARGKQGN